LFFDGAAAFLTAICGIVGLYFTGAMFGIPDAYFWLAALFVATSY